MFDIVEIIVEIKFKNTIGNKSLKCIIHCVVIADKI
jgi:hypothetical protein